MEWFLIVSIVCFFLGSAWRSLFFAGIVSELAYMAVRGSALGRLPLLGPHDTLVFFALSLALMAFITSFSPTVRHARWFIIASGILAGLFTMAALAFRPLNMPLPQILDTLWFELHVVLAFFAYALF